ncbi:hypothetical protein [Nocardia brasiliensis]|uniref:LuxE/PaaK family acyltransferase n=1 Tax=Nocardia brasiliensis TaxID=37326 RepID=UPI0004A774A0|nr:hypothetical protein [Nocardia brasiliensis]
MTTHAKVTVIDSIRAIDDLIHQRDDAFTLAGAELEELRDEVMRAAVRHHWQYCAAYRRYAEANEWSPARLDRPGFIESLPLIPASVFKRRDVSSCAPEKVVQVCTSSGTRGTKSRIYRDGTTLERFVGSIEQGSRLALPNPEIERQLFVLGPDTTEAGDLWFSYVLSIVDLLHPTRFCVTAGIFRIDEVIAALLDESIDRPVIVGPPALVRDLAAALRERGIDPRLGARNGLVITAGGWKRANTTAMSRRDFEEFVTAAFGLAGEAPIRDCYNAVELNTVLFECRFRAKHLPAWLHTSARDPATMRPLPPGEVGVLAFCDASPTSYPGFVATDDLGSVSREGSCPCGNDSAVLTVLRRITTAETRGCALRLDAEVIR